MPAFRKDNGLLGLGDGRQERDDGDMKHGADKRRWGIVGRRVYLRERNLLDLRAMPCPKYARLEEG